MTENQLATAKPHYAARWENAVRSRVADVLRSRGWLPRPTAFVGYGTLDQARVYARVQLHRPHQEGALPTAVQDVQQFLTRRGWRAFISAPDAGVPVKVTLGDAVVMARADRGGYVEQVLTGHGLPPGTHRVTFECPGGAISQSDVHIADPAARIGLVSDIDDTVISTHLPRPLIAAWNTFALTEQARTEVPGMADTYRAVLSQHPGAPVFYLSTGAWNTQPFLHRFLKRHGFPPGTLLLTDWGPTNTGWFRSGRAHKERHLERLAQEFPDVQWVLVGDDGQHDPVIYDGFAEAWPGRVAAIAIRRLTAIEHALSRGLPLALAEMAHKYQGQVPVVAAFDGFELLPQLLRAVGGNGCVLPLGEPGGLDELEAGAAESADGRASESEGGASGAGDPGREDAPGA
ncbi:App1 family protein [Kytococcus sp. Marseille-QA3725]